MEWTDKEGIKIGNENVSEDIHHAFTKVHLRTSKININEWVNWILV